jgi:hypothetical protein
MTERILRRDDLDKSMNDINLDEWKNLVVLCAANRYDGIKLGDRDHRVSRSASGFAARPAPRPRHRPAPGVNRKPAIEEEHQARD